MDFLEKGTILGGEIFKQILFGIRLIKIVEEDNKEDYNILLKSGYNERKIEINHNASYQWGGIKFSTINDFYKLFSRYYDKHEYYWDIEIPEEATISVDTDCFKTDKIFLLGCRRRIEDLEVWNDKSFCLEALKHSSKPFKFVKNPSLEQQIEFVKRERDNIKIFENPPEEVCIACVTEHYSSLDLIKNQTDNIVLAAMKKSDYNSRYIKIMSEDLAIKLVQMNKSFYKDIEKKYKTEKVILEMLKNDIGFIKEVEHQTQTMVDYVLSKDLSLIKYLDQKLVPKEKYYEYFERDVSIFELMPKEYQTYEMCFRAVNERPNFISFIENKTDDLCWCAIMKNHNLIKHVPKPNKEMILYACKFGSEIIHDIQSLENADDEIIKKYINDRPELIKYCKDQTEDLCKKSLEKDGMMLEFIKNKTLELCLVATKQNYNAIRFVKPDMITYDMYIEPLKKNPRLLKDIPLELQTEEMCLRCVITDGMVLQYVLKQTYKICVEAVISDSEALKFVDKYLLSEDICYSGVKKKGMTIEYIPEKFQTEKVCLAAIRNNPLSLQFIEKKTPGLCNEAFSINIKAIKYIPFPTERMWL